MNNQYPVQLNSLGGPTAPADGSVPDDEDSDDRPRRDLLIARCGSMLVGLFADEADSIIRWKNPTPLPFSPSAVRGIISVRGRVLTVLDPLEVLGLTNEACVAYKYIVGLLGDEQLGVGVDRVERIVEILIEDIIDIQTADTEGLIYGRIEIADCTVTILNVSRIFDFAIRSTE